MLPQFLGMLLLTGTAGAVVLALGLALWARSRDNRVLARRALLAGNPLVQRQRRLALPAPTGA